MSSGGIVFRAARRDDCPRIAELFKMSSDGVVEYIRGGLRDEYPGLSKVEAGFSGVGVLPVENDMWRFYRLLA